MTKKKVFVQALNSPFATDYNRYCFKKYLQVAGQTPVVNIFHIQLHPVFKRDAIPTADLPDTDNSRAYAKRLRCQSWQKPL